MASNFPSKLSQPAGLALMIGGMIVTIIGVTVIFPVTIQYEGSMWFAIGWTALAIATTVIGTLIALSDKGLPAKAMVMPTPPPANPRTTEARLRELDEMRHKQLISEAEYVAMRKKILDAV
ncbi:MAG: SHOCT domain-containing protein [Kiritimatiellaeota bacterium]|nr:SHOCT domain-containing protein [Kiritimatiellota bacterium]